MEQLICKSFLLHYPPPCLFFFFFSLIFLSSIFSIFLFIFVSLLCFQRVSMVGQGQCTVCQHQIITPTPLQPPPLLLPLPQTRPLPQTLPLPQALCLPILPPLPLLPPLPIHLHLSPI